MSARVKYLFVLISAAAAALAAPPLSSIHDVLYRADGGLFDGSADISWNSFVASDTSYVPQNKLTIRIVNGQLNVKLVPSSNANPSTVYHVRYNTNGQTMFTEFWSVPPNTSTLKVTDVRVSSGTTTGGTGGTGGGLPSALQISDITGLSDALAMRPVKGLLYSAARVAWIDETGALSVVSGNSGDCVRVDGTAGACGSAGGGSSITFVDLEIPSGTIDGVSPSFSTSVVPAPASSLHLFRNGILQRAGTDYNLLGSAVTFVAGAIPQPGDILLASYRVTQ